MLTILVIVAIIAATAVWRILHKRSRANATTRADVFFRAAGNLLNKVLLTKEDEFEQGSTDFEYTLELGFAALRPEILKQVKAGTNDTMYLVWTIPSEPFKPLSTEMDQLERDLNQRVTNFAGAAGRRVSSTTRGTSTQVTFLVRTEMCEIGGEDWGTSVGRSLAAARRRAGVDGAEWVLVSPTNSSVATAYDDASSVTSAAPENITTRAPQLPKWQGTLFVDGKKLMSAPVIEGCEFLVGRSVRAALRVPEELSMSSRKHLLFMQRGGVLSGQDHSTNGAFLVLSGGERRAVPRAGKTEASLTVSSATTILLDEEGRVQVQFARLAGR